MAVDSLGTRGQPQFDDSLGFDLGADLTAVATYAATLGNRMVGTQAARNNFSNTFGFAPWNGLEYYEQDTNVTWRYNGTAWRPFDSDWAGFSPTVQGVNGYASGGRWRYRAGRVLLSWTFTLNSSSSSVASAPYVQLPVTADTSNPGYGAYDNPVQESRVYDASDGQRAYVLFASLVSGTNLGLSALTTATGKLGGAGNQPIAFTNGDTFTGVFEYDPA